MLLVLALIGYAACLLGLLSITASWFVMAVIGLGRYNIGGVENPRSTKVAIIVSGIVLFFAWRWLLSFIVINVSFT